MLINWLQPFSRPYKTEPAWKKYVVIWTENVCEKGKQKNGWSAGGDPPLILGVA